MTKTTKTKTETKINFEQALTKLVERHQYPRAQHTPDGAELNMKPLATEIDIIAEIKKGTKIGWLDISPLGLPKSFYKELCAALKGAPYTSHETDQQLCVVDRFFYTTKHQSADEKGIPCINFDTVLLALYNTKDEDVLAFLGTDTGKIFHEKVKAFMDKLDAKSNKPKVKWNKPKVV